MSLFLSVHGRTDGSEEMRVVKIDSVLIIKFESSDKCSTELVQEVERTTKECNMSADWLSTGKS